MRKQSDFEIVGSLEKIKKVRKDKKKHHTPKYFEDDETTFKAAGKKGHSRHVEDYGFDDDEELEQYRHVLK